MTRVIMVILLGILAAQTEEKTITIDPSVLKNPDPNWPTVIHPLIPESETILETKSVERTGKLINGYRVQVLATRFYEKADSLRESLVAQFHNEVYIDFEAPNYKVRIGNFPVRKDAEALQDQLIKQGFSSAWIIRTRVYETP